MAALISHAIHTAMFQETSPAAIYEMMNADYHHQQQLQLQPQQQQISSYHQHPYSPCGGDGESAMTTRWPAQYAKSIAEKIHRQVCDMLGHSRLVRNANEVMLVQRSDIVRVHKVLGEGAFSQVSSVTATDGRRYACKHLKQRLMDQPDDFRLAAAELACEAHMLASFDHPNILKIRGWAGNGITSFEEGYHDSFFLLLDQLDETLDQRIMRWQAEEQQQRSQQQLAASLLVCPRNASSQFADAWRRTTTAISMPSELPPSPLLQQPSQPGINVVHENLYAEKLRIMTDIASALEYLHERGVIFRDLKPNNIGFLNGTQVQLFDFGLSRELPALDTSIPFEMSGKVGTLRYMAPEVALHQPYNVAADVYSWAMVCYEMLSYEKPFDGWTREMHASYVCDRGMRPDVVNCIGTVPHDMRMLLDLAWHSVPCNRPAIGNLGAQVQFLREQHHIQLFNEDQQQQEHHRRLQQQQEQLRHEEEQLKQQILAHQIEQEQQQHVRRHQQQQQEQQQRLYEQRQQQQEAAAAAYAEVAAAAAVADSMFVNLTYVEREAPRKLARSHSLDSIGTIETSSLSADSEDRSTVRYY